MRALRNILHFMLILAILSTGLPLYHAGDANRDGAVDLSDAIVSVRQLVRAAAEETAFRAGMENALTSLSVVANLKTILKEDRGTAAGSNTHGGPVPALMPSQAPEVLPVAAAPGATLHFLYISPVLTPLTPPPISA